MRPFQPALRRTVAATTLCAVTIGLAVGAASPASAEAVTTWTAATPVPVGSYPSHITVDSAHGGLAYVNVNDGNGAQLKVVDPTSNTVANTITTATPFPNAVLLDPASQLVYATAYSNSISVTTHEGVAQPPITISGATSLGGISLDAVTQTLYVIGSANSNMGMPTSSLFAVDLVTGTSRTVANLGYSMMGGSQPLVLDLTSHVAYTGTGNSTVVDLTTGTVSSTPYLGNQVAVDPSRHALWTANANGSASLLDTGTGKLVVTIPLGGNPSAVAVDPADGRVYVANASYNSVSVIDETSHAVVATVPVDVNPVALAVNPNTHTVYTVNSGSAGTVSVITKTTQYVNRSQTVKFTSTPPAKAYAQTTYTATAVGGRSGNRVHFSTDPRSYGVCNVSVRGKVLFARAGTCIVDADQDGTGPWSDAPTATQKITVLRRTQTITFPQPAPLKVGRTQTLHATSSAKLPVTYTVSTPRICSVRGATVHARTAGTCRVYAHAAGTTVYGAAATKPTTFTVTT
ncbi:MAG TPA: YncE family protein [Pedococcus sp.]|jgi:YVTN family beta-propeller protein|nr:YncE family protein [Pedococcus sp.]